MKNNIHKYIAPLALSVGPMTAFAQETGAFYILQRVQDFMNALVPIIITLGLLYFLWGVVQYIQSPDDREKARDTMIGGILALFVMTSVWGLVNLFAASINFNTRQDSPTVIPTVPKLAPQR